MDLSNPEGHQTSPEQNKTVTVEQRDTTTPSYKFKTPEGQAEFMAAYDRALARWPVPYQVVFVPTRLGVTHVLAGGPEDAPPLVLLHGTSTNSTIWRHNVAPLSQSHRTYLVDIVGLPNKSSNARFPKTRQEAVEWLLDVFDGLGIEKAHLGGFSFGGWLTLSFGIAQPDRLHGIVPMTCGLGQLRWVPLISATVRLLLMVLRPTRARVEGLWRYVTASDQWIEEELVDQAYLGWKHFKLSKGVLPSLRAKTS